MEYKIDATNKILGRLASEVAVKLRGKEKAQFSPSHASGNRVVIFNTDHVRVTGRKEIQKLYRRHSGYLGNLREENLRTLMARDSRRVIAEAVSGMLPKNKLRKQMMKNLILVKGEREQ